MAAAQGRNSARCAISVEAYTKPVYRWENNPGITFWNVRLTLAYDAKRTADLPNVVIGHATLVAVDRWRCAEIAYELDQFDGDLSALGSAVEQVVQLEDWVGDRVLLCADLVVDEHWRGGGIGPALLWCAVEYLNAGSLFLAPLALPTIVSEGVCYSKYDAKRPGPAATKKVRAAYRRAGLRVAPDGVLWAVTDPALLDAARERIRHIETVATTERNRRWWRARSRQVQ